MTMELPSGETLTTSKFTELKNSSSVSLGLAVCAGAKIEAQKIEEQRMDTSETGKKKVDRRIGDSHMGTVERRASSPGHDGIDVREGQARTPITPLRLAVFDQGSRSRIVDRVKVPPVARCVAIGPAADYLVWLLPPRASRHRSCGILPSTSIGLHCRKALRPPGSKISNAR